MSEVLDVVIVGAGTAGLAAAREVGRRTDRFVLVNDGPYGTTCARVGCMPSKVLIEAANAFHRRRGLDAFGVRGAEALTVDLPAVMRHVRALRDDFVSGTLKITERLGERSISGRARLLGPDRVDVDGRELRARRIVLAPGSRPVVPAPWRALGDRVLTTDTLFEQPTLPQRIAVVGLGAIGVEVAQALARLGLTVVAYDAAERLAGLVDPVVEAALREALSRDFAVRTGVAVTLSAAGDGVDVAAGDEHVTVDRVIAAVGRRPNLEGLGLETLGVALDARGLPPVDPTTMRIGDLPVFLAGDANGDRPLLHEAADEGHIAGLNAVSSELLCFERRLPLGIVFCDPNVATVGQRFDALDPARTLVGEASFHRQGRSRMSGRDRGVVRLYAERGTGRLLGAALCAPDGEHLAHLLALAIARASTVADLLRMPIYHPVIEEGLRTAIRDLSRQLSSSGDSDLAACGGFRAEALD